MKILFVCKGNIGRSQMAKEIYNSLTDDIHASDACGTCVFENEGQRITDIQSESIEADIKAMSDLGLDISKNTRKHITPELVDEADRVIVMAEKETWPEFLKNSTKVVYWEVKNPKGMSYEETCEVRDVIRKKIDELI